MSAATDTPRDAVADATELLRLAQLDAITYDREREAAAKRLGIRTSTLDPQVAALRPKPETARARGVSLAAVEPWPDPVNGAALLTRLTAVIRRHIILPQAGADCVALWIAHTWVPQRFQHTPRLGIGSPAKRCGKSTLMDVLRATCCRSLKADNISASGVFRTVEALREEGGLTLLVDEADTFLGDNEELRGILNSGFEASGEVIRVVELGGEHRAVRFATFCPVALAGIGKLPDTLADRCVPITLQRKAAGETVVKLRAPGARDMLHTAARCLARWAQDHGAKLPLSPDIPEAMGDREGDISVPLLAIADAAGGEWPARARAALLEVFGLRNASEGNMEAGALLLADLRLLFVGNSATRLTSAGICEHLGQMEDRPWPEWKHGKPMTPTQLARALAPFGVRPANLRGPDGRVVKGYHREGFEEAWTRYLTPDGPSAAENPHSSRYTATSKEKPGFAGDSEPLQDPPCSGYENVPKPSENLGCSGVADQKPPFGENKGSDVFEDAL
jgi:putative DNA primase/helicase